LIDFGRGYDTIYEYGNATAQGREEERTEMSLYDPTIGKLLIRCLAAYAKEAGQADDVVALIRSYNPMAHHRFVSALEKLDTFADDLDDASPYDLNDRPDK
jgi:hypothetical protein